MSVSLLVSKEKVLPVVKSRPADQPVKKKCLAPKGNARFAPIDQLLNRINQCEELRACA